MSFPPQGNGIRDIESPLLTLFSDSLALLTLTNGALTQALPAITIAGLPVGAVVTYAQAILSWRETEEDSTATNSLSGAQVIQAQKAVAGAWITAINFVNGQIRCPASSRGAGDAKGGSANIAAQVPASGAVMNFQWLSSLSVGASLYLRDVQVILRIWYHM